MVVPSSSVVVASSSSKGGATVADMEGKAGGCSNKGNFQKRNVYDKLH